MELQNIFTSVGPGIYYYEQTEERKLRSRNGGKHLFSTPHKKLKEDFAVTYELMPGIMRN